MLIVRYSDDAERKRFESVLERWRSRVKISKPSGAVVIVSADTADMVSFLDDLYSRVPREHVEVYRLTEPEFLMEPLVLRGKVETSMEPGGVWGAVNLTMARFRGVLISETQYVKRYRVSTRKGSCDIEFSVHRVDGRTVLEFAVEGFGEAVPFVYDRVSHELSYLKEVR